MVVHDAYGELELVLLLHIRAVGKDVQLLLIREGLDDVGDDEQHDHRKVKAPSTDTADLAAEILLEGGDGVGGA